MSDRTSPSAAGNGDEAHGLHRLVGRVFPKTPDFFALLKSQSELAVSTMASLVEFMEAGLEGGATKDHSRAVRAYEHEGDELKERSMAALNSAFSTPMDREDLYRAVTTLDHVVNYAKSTVREMDLLGVTPDRFTLEMAQQLLEGAKALDAGYGKLGKQTADAEVDAQRARKAERNIEKLYRSALADLFDVEAQLTDLETMDQHTGPATLKQVIEIFKKREIYRHLSNAGDRLAHGGEALHDIVVKMV